MKTPSYHDIYRKHIESYLTRWQPEKVPHESSEQSVAESFYRFFDSNHNLLTRDNLTGHMTASCLIVDDQFEEALLTYHRKLGKWLQLGGHADGEGDLSRVAACEGHEESGLASLYWVCHPLTDSVPIDYDVHRIPRHHDTPAHNHYDARYLFVAYKKEPIKISDESIDLRWIPCSKIRDYSNEASLLRLFDKLEYLKPLVLDAPLKPVQLAH